MARTKIDLQRFRKVYPQIRSAPVLFEQTNEVDTHKITFSSERSKTIGVGRYNYPVVVLTAEDNINVWVSAVVRVNSTDPNRRTWQISVETSIDYTGVVHMHVAEGNPA